MPIKGIYFTIKEELKIHFVFLDYHCIVIVYGKNKLSISALIIHQDFHCLFKKSILYLNKAPKLVCSYSKISWKH